MRQDAIYIRTRSHVIRMCPRTGIFDVAPSRVVYHDRFEYKSNYSYDLFERLFKEQFSMSGCADEILNMFYTVLGLWLNPESEKTNVVIVGKKSLATYYLIKIIAAVTGTRSRHDLFLYESDNDFKFKNRYKKIDFVFRMCPVDNNIKHDDNYYRIVLEMDRELENIQYKAIKALSEYFKNGGFKQPEYCLTALKNLTTDDHMDRYVSEQFVICSDSDVSTEANKAHHNYMEWHFANEIRQPYLVKRRFYKTIREMGFRLERSNNVYRISGVLLKNQRTNQSLTSLKENGLIT